MNTDYHTVEAAPQCRAGRSRGKNDVSLQLGAARAVKPLPIAMPRSGDHPLLVGDRDMLRRLRAAEMAAWESVRPSTIATESSVSELRATRQHLVTPHPLQAESFLFFVLAICAGAALFNGLGDVSELLANWTQFTQGIGHLLR